MKLIEALVDREKEKMTDAPRQLMLALDDLSAKGDIGPFTLDGTKYSLTVGRATEIVGCGLWAVLGSSTLGIRKYLAGSGWVPVSDPFEADFVCHTLNKMVEVKEPHVLDDDLGGK